MATLNLELQDYEVEPSELSICVWEAPAFLEDNSISPEDLHGEWTALDLYIREECTPNLDADKIADLIRCGGWELHDLDLFISQAVHCLKMRVMAEKERVSEANERIRELERPTAA
jgi:hypothetical protein